MAYHQLIGSISVFWLKTARMKTTLTLSSIIIILLPLSDKRHLLALLYLTYN
jgi:hypothetical protein